MTIPGERSGTDGVLSDERNWSELPEEIIHLFSKKLPDISDFIRFRAVCKRWQLSAPVNDPPPQLPWLLERHEAPVTDSPPQLPWLVERHQDIENAIIRFYCLSSGKVHTITCPSSRHAWLNGPGCRYLLASYLGNSERYLINPLTRDQICVPDIVNVHGFLPDYIGPNPIEGGDIVVISGIKKYFHPLNAPPIFMGFWRPMADDWVFVEGVGCSANAYYMGQYFCHDFVNGITNVGITNVIDIATKKMAYQVAPPKGTNPLLKGTTIMVESGGKILRLFQHYEDEQYHFDIYCLYFGDGEPKPYWMKITEIGDQMLFLQNYRGLSFCASNFAGFKGNCIYFLKDER